MNTATCFENILGSSNRVMGLLGRRQPKTNHSRGGTSTVVKGHFVPAHGKLKHNHQHHHAGHCHGHHNGNSHAMDQCKFSPQAKAIFMLGALMSMMSGNQGASILQQLLSAGMPSAGGNECAYPAPRGDIGGPPTACPSVPSFGCASKAFWGEMG